MVYYINVFNKNKTMKKLSCPKYFSINFKSNRLVFQQNAPGETLEGQPVASLKTESGDEFTRKIVGSAIVHCSESMCKLERFEEQWKKNTNLMLGKIQEASTSDKVALNTVLKELVTANGKKMEPGISIVDNFYDAMKIIGVPDTEVGHNTFWNDILFQAKENSNATGSPQKYEFLKSIVDSIRNQKETAKNN